MSWQQHNFNNTTQQKFILNFFWELSNKLKHTHREMSILFFIDIFIFDNICDVYTTEPIHVYHTTKQTNLDL